MSLSAGQVGSRGPKVWATGGTVTTSGGYRIHTFTTVGTATLTVESGGSVEALVVAGGGGGGGGPQYSGIGGGGYSGSTSISVPCASSCAMASFEA